MKVQVKVAVKVQIHFSHPEKLVTRPRELSTSRNTLTSEKGRYAANKILYLFAQHYYQCTLIGTPGTGNKTQCFPFFFFFPVINSLREHPFFSALVSSLFFGVRSDDRKYVCGSQAIYNREKEIKWKTLCFVACSRCSDQGALIVMLGEKI